MFDPSRHCPATPKHPIKHIYEHLSLKLVVSLNRKCVYLYIYSKARNDKAKSINWFVLELTKSLSESEAFLSVCQKLSYIVETAI